ncbi:DoxX family protein [Sorangium sp. So ce1078]|uniref:DoxX family protein n=1 Tax=Sorangium sp. So ce1078 TaxID=3133329 RepID=UPI003F62204F
MTTSTRETDLEDVGKLVLRSGIAALMLSHGVYKLIHGHGHVLQYFASAGLPSWLGHGALLTEVAAPLAMIVGYKTRHAGSRRGGSARAAVFRPGGAPQPPPTAERLAKQHSAAVEPLDRRMRVLVQLRGYLRGGGAQGGFGEHCAQLRREPPQDTERQPGVHLVKRRRLARRP